MQSYKRDADAMQHDGHGRSGHSELFADVHDFGVLAIAHFQYFAPAARDLLQAMSQRFAAVLVL